MLKELRALLSRVVDDAGLWRDVCDELAFLFGGKGTALLPVDAEVRGPWIVLSDSISALAEEYFTDGWHLQDFRENGVPMLVDPGYFTDHDLISRADMDTMPYYRDYHYPHGLGQSVCLGINTANRLWVAAIQCHKDRDPLTDGEIAALLEAKAAIEETVRRCEDVSGRKLAQFIALLGEELSDIYVCDPHMTVLDHVDGNAAVPLPVLPDTLEDLSAVMVRGDHDALRALCESGADTIGVVDTDMMIDAQCLRLIARPVPRSLRHFYSPAKLVITVRRAGASVDETLHETLRRRYSLSIKEAEMTVLLANGETVEEIANQQNITIGTGRQRLKAIFAKTGTDRQAKLVSQVLLQDLGRQDKPSG